MAQRLHRERTLLACRYRLVLLADSNLFAGNFSSFWLAYTNQYKCRPGACPDTAQSP